MRYDLGMSEVSLSRCAGRAALAAFAALVLLPTTTFAYRLTETATGQHARWHVSASQPISYTIDKDLGDDLNLGEEYARTVIVAASKQWQGVVCDVCHDPRGIACSPVKCDSHPLGVRFVDEPQWAEQSTMLGPSCVSPAGEVTAITDGNCPKVGGPWKKQSNGNQVAFLKGDQWVFSQYTIALTLVAANQVSGKIVDSDILVNARDKVFCAIDCLGHEYDLQSTLTHEFGHMLGLDHSDAPKATMILQGQPGETFMRDLSEDDVAGVCQAYRMAYDPNGCPPLDDGFFDCSAARIGHLGGVTFGLLWVALLVLLCARFTSVAGEWLYSGGNVDHRAAHEEPKRSSQRDV